jgi:2-oxoisovalerate dehydrogenase E1 component
LKLHLLNVDGVGEVTLLSIEEENKSIVSESADRAEAAPDPDPASVMQFVTPDESKVASGSMIAEEGPPITLLNAINQTLKQEFPPQSEHLSLGTGRRLQREGRRFQRDQGNATGVRAQPVFNAPIAEDFIVGTANGFSRFRDDIWVVIEGRPVCGLCVGRRWNRSSTRRTITIARTASSCPISLPGLLRRLHRRGALSLAESRSDIRDASGLRIVAPAFADDAAGLLRHAMRSRGITFYLEPKYLYNQVFAKAPNPGETYEISFGKARIRREGTDLTIVSYGTALHWSLRAATQLKDEHGIEAEVIDLRTLVPLDMETVVTSVRKTSKLLIGARG